MHSVQNIVITVCNFIIIIHVHSIVLSLMFCSIGTRVTLDTGTLRDSDSPTPNVNVEITNHIGNNLENDVELLNKNLVNMDGSCIVKTEGMPSK